MTNCPFDIIFKKLIYMFSVIPKFLEALTHGATLLLSYKHARIIKQTSKFPRISKHDLEVACPIPFHPKVRWVHFLEEKSRIAPSQKNSSSHAKVLLQEMSILGYIKHCQCKMHILYCNILFPLHFEFVF